MTLRDHDNIYMCTLPDVQLKNGIILLDKIAFKRLQLIMCEYYGNISCLKSLVVKAALCKVTFISILFFVHPGDLCRDAGH